MTGRHQDQGPVSAEDLLAELGEDPVYQKKLRRQDHLLSKREAEWRRAEAPLVSELRAAGFEVESAWDLVNTSTPYPAALPILLSHLQQPYPDRVREGVARALAVPDARFAWGVLVELYRNEEAGTDTKDGLAVALAAVADDDKVDDIIRLAQDPAHGESRILLLLRLKRSRAPQARAALGRFAQDPVLGREARALMGDARGVPPL